MEPNLSDLSVAMKTPQSTHPLSSSLLDSTEGDGNAVSQSLSRGIAKRFGFQCFVSYNLPPRFEEYMVEIMGPMIAAVEQIAAAEAI